MGTAVKGMFNEVNLKLLTIIDFIRCLQIPPRHTLFLRLMIGYQVDSNCKFYTLRVLSCSRYKLP